MNMVQKKVLAVLLAMAMLCGFAAVGAVAEPVTADFNAAMTEAITAAAAEELQTWEEYQKELEESKKNVRALEELTSLLYTVPPFLKWTLFSWGCSVESMDADMKAELEKENFHIEDFLKWAEDGALFEHLDDILAYSKVQNEKYPEVIKKNCVFYVDWYVDYVVARVK